MEEEIVDEKATSNNVVCNESPSSKGNDEEADRVGSVEPFTKQDDHTSQALSTTDVNLQESELLYQKVCAERDKLMKELEALRTEHQEKENSLQEVTRELERKLVAKGEKIDELTEELSSERENSNKKLIELEKKLSQTSSQCEGLIKEKDEVIGKLGLLESERLKLINEVTSAEVKVMEVAKENERLSNFVKKHKTEGARAQSSLEKSEKQCSDLTREVTKLKEEVGSLSIKVKWAQNKLKTETDGHKETKAQLAVSTKKLKEAREEGEQIRADLKTMIQQYQESEEMRSNSLGLKLEKTEKELKLHEQEIADQQELHELTVKELELVKASYKIAQQEVAQYKTKLAEASGRATAQAEELEEFKQSLSKMREDKSKLSSEKSELEKLSQTMETERSKFSALREAFTTTQKSHQHLEREVGRRKEKEAELLSLIEKLSSANAEMKAELCDTETKVTSLTAERDLLTQRLREAEERGAGLEERVREMTESSHTETERLTKQLSNRSKAVEELTLALEDEREMVRAARKKNASSIRDLQRQLQHSKRRIDQLEASLQAEREAPATLPITDGSRASSQNSLNEAVSHNSNAMVTLIPQTAAVSGVGGAQLSDEERAGASPSPELMFQTMDQEKLLLVDRLCRSKKEVARLEEKIEFFEEHVSQLTEDIQRKSKIIQNFILREQSGVLAPAAYDEHKARHSKKGGVMATVFTGGKGHRVHNTEMTYDLSLEMNRKMQSILEDTLLKNITLKENIDTLGMEIQRLSAQLHAYEIHAR